MFCRTLFHWRHHTVLVAIFMTFPAAYAAVPANDTAGSIGMLPLMASALSPRELDEVRGGFDVTPHLTINFAFQQIISNGSTVIQSIEVPTVTLTRNAPSITPIITPTNSLNPAGNNMPNNTLPAASTYAASNSSKITLTSTANNGQSTVLSQLGNGGITNVISNTANNAMLSQVTTMNIAVTGLSSWLSGQHSGLAAGGVAFGSSGVYR